MATSLNTVIVVMLVTQHEPAGHKMRKVLQVSALGSNLYSADEVQLTNLQGKNE